MRRTPPAWIAVALALAATGAPAAPGVAQVPELTVERIFGTQELQSDLVSLEWRPDGRHYTTIELDADGNTDLVRVAAITGRREVLVRGRDLVPPGAREPIEIEAYAFSADGSKLLLFTNSVRVWRRHTKGTYYVWTLQTRTLTPISTRAGYQMFAKLAPDGRSVAFVREHNLYLTDLATGAERALTTDGDENIINGTTDWVYEEELDLSDAFRWSPDGRRIAFWRFDQTPIRPFYLLDELPLYPELKPVRYPKAGMENSKVRIGVMEVASGAVTWIDPGTSEDGYIARMDFAGSPNEVWFQWLNRHQNRMELKMADVRTGESRTVTTDADSAWLDVHEPIWLEGGKRFLLLSERDGYAQLTLYDRDGTLVRKVTTGAWDVLDVYGVDEKAGVVYFTGAADGPLGRPLYRIGLDGKGFRRISSAPGTHDVLFNPTFTLYVDVTSRAGAPPVQSLRSADGSLVRSLAANPDLDETLLGLGLRSPEFLKVPLGNGVELNAYVIKPPDFDPSKRYPLVVYVYGGPGSQTVTDAWGGDRYLWHQVLARKGFLVASVDNRGTGARGVAFKKVTYLRLGQIESEDQIAAARYFASLPYVDPERIGIWGWSYGGTMAALCLLRGDGVFKTAIAVAPVTDWRLYDTIYTERFMRTPKENPDGYARGAVVTYADRLRGSLLLVHGTGDDNVHAQNTIQLVQRLEEANRQFDLRLYPNKTHSISGSAARVNLFTWMTAYLEENL
ncbi:MAG: S9 family peptidase [Gemmatimonadota bacterium]